MPVSSVLTNLFSTSTNLRLDDSSSCSNVVGQVSGTAGVFDNGVTELFVVRSTSPAATEACLSDMTSAVNQRTGGNYMAMVTSETTASRAAATMATESLQSASTRFHSMASLYANTTDLTYYGPKYITPDIVMGLLVVAILLIILFVGMCCVMSIESPLRFATPSQKLNIGKEY